jgi:hypothetical protein
VRTWRRVLKGNVEIHPDLALDVLEATLDRLTSTSPPLSPLEGRDTSCKYHSHGDEKPCYKTKHAK